MTNLVRSKFRVKIKSLACEGRIIRKEIRRYKGDSNAEVRDSLHVHNVNVVRREARATQWAYAYLRGVPYRSIERRTETCQYDKHWLTKRAAEIVYSLARTSVREQDIANWLQAVGVQEAA